MKTLFRRSATAAFFLLAFPTAIWAIERPACTSCEEAGAVLENTADNDGTRSYDGKKTTTAQDTPTLGDSPEPVAGNKGRKSAPPPPANPAPTRKPPTAVPSLTTDSHTVEADPEPGFMSKLSKSPLTWIFGGALLGAAIGGFAFGPAGFLLGGILGVAAGFFGKLFLGS